MPRLRRGLLAGLAVVALGALCYFMFRPSAATPKRDSMKDRGLIKSVTPAPAPKFVEKEKPKKPEKPIWEQPMPKGLDPISQEAWKRKMAYEKKLATDTRLQRYLKTLKPRPSIYHTGTEQVLDWIFYTKVGDHPPPPLPPMSEYELNHIDDILDTVNEIKEDDDAKTAERKKIVDEVKKDLKAYVAEGGDPRDFLQHYYNELERAYELKVMVSDEIAKEVSGSTDSAESIKFIEKANKLLEDKGIPEVELTEDQKKTLEEGFKDE